MSIIKFDLMISDCDDGCCLATIEAETLPRKGDQFIIWGKKATGKAMGESGAVPLIAKVVSVDWEVDLDLPTKAKRVENIRVWVHDDEPMFIPFCMCTDEEREKQHKPGLNDDNGCCFNCGDKRP